MRSLAAILLALAAAVLPGCGFTDLLWRATGARVSGTRDNEVVEVLSCATTPAPDGSFTPVRVRVVTYDGAMREYVLDGRDALPRTLPADGGEPARGTVPWVWIPDNAGYERVPRAPTPLPVDLVAERTVRRFPGVLRPHEAREAVILVASPRTVGDVAADVEVYFPRRGTRNLPPGDRAAELRLGLPDQRVILRLAEDKPYEWRRFTRNARGATLFFLAVPFTFVLDLLTWPFQPLFMDDDR